jgi:hypothetical protein
VGIRLSVITVVPLALDAGELAARCSIERNAGS